MEPEYAVERPLGRFEQLLWTVDTVVRINFVMVAELSGPLSVEALRAGLDAAQERHPLLRVCIARDAQGQLGFKRMHEKLPLRVAEAPAEAWNGEAERELQ